MRQSRVIVATIVLLIAFGCVLKTHHTIEAHITVDIRHVEAQADNVLDFIEGKTDEVPKVAPGTNSDGASLFQRFGDVLCPIPVAHAAELKESSPLVTQILKELRERYPKIQALKTQKSLGEDNRGYVDLRSFDAFKTPEAKNEAQKLVAAENKNRKDLYKEIARLNEESKVTISIVERIYAQKRLERAKPGEIFQLPPKGEDFEAFKNSALGKRLGDACQSDAWVTIK